MKLTKEKMYKLFEMIKNNLRERLKREPTEEEVCSCLPLFLCKNDDASIAEAHKDTE